MFGLPRFPPRVPVRREHQCLQGGGEIFALTPLSAKPLRVSLKSDPDLAVQFRTAHPAINAGYHLNKRHWNTVVLDRSVPDELVRETIENSYDFVVAQLSKREKEKLKWIALSSERTK
ncbi:MmcQ/YjbR family DNA-binding protein [Amycolatopsis sp. cmx-11-51]|uniref:MmcQ/YjbR family DNA-binding protein n=1 Tax=Amycolatopsis sp. cmx-11-51 TaxID=2785797 RepID=UPI0039E6ABD9